MYLITGFIVVKLVVGYIVRIMLVVVLFFSNKCLDFEK